VEVKYRGSISAKIAFVGESPGASEEHSGYAFVGDSGKRLTGILREYGVTDYMLLNSARCRIDKKALTVSKIKKILKCCRTPIEKILKKQKPKLIVCLGKYAMYQITGMSGIEKRKGGFYKCPEFDCDVFVMNHPAATLYDPSKLPQFKKHIKIVSDYISNEYQIAEGKYGKYKTVQSIAFLLAKQNITVGLDCESQGLLWTHPDHPVLCYSVSDADDVGYTVWLHGEVPVDKADYTFEYNRPSRTGSTVRYKNTTIGVKRFPDYDRRITELKELLARKDIKKIMMNGNFDLLMFYKLFGYKKFEINSYTMDIQAAAHVLDENLYQLSDLSRLTSDFTDIPNGKKEMYRMEMQMGDLLGENPTTVSSYAASDADDTRQTGIAIKKELLKHPVQARYFIHLVQPVMTNVLFPLERNGILIDTDYLPVVEKDTKKALQIAEQQCVREIQKKRGVINKYKDSGKGIVLTRRDIIRDFLFDKRIGHGLSPVSTTKTGVPSVGKDDLKFLIERTDSMSVLSFLRSYSEFSELSTLYTRYLRGMRKFIHSDGRIHAVYTIAQTVTGRSSTSRPNVQNIPKRSDKANTIRRLFIAPPGWKLLALDYANSELRWIAHVSQDRTMLEVFRNDGDIHTTTAENVLRKKLSDMTKEEAERVRRSAKSIVFGFMYGMWPERFRVFAYTDYNLSITLSESRKYRNDFFSLYSGIERWHNSSINKVIRDKYIDSPIGRRRHLPMIDSDNPAIVSLAKRQAINSPIQSISSDSGLLAASEIRRKRLLDPEKSCIALFIHDELVYCVRDGYEEEARDVIINEMENLPFHRFGLRMTVPLRADCKIGQNLAEMKSF